MPIYKKARKLAAGGRPNSIFNNPGLTLGLEYVPSNPYLPDLEGLQYVENAKNEARIKLETLKEKSVPDGSKMLEELDKLEMFNSQKNSYKNEIGQMISSFRSKMIEDPEYGYSMQARQDFSELQKNLSASNFRNNALKYKEVNADFKHSTDNGFGQELYVRNGMVPVVSVKKPGEVNMVGIEKAKELMDDPDNNGDYYVLPNSSSLYEFYHKNTGKDFTNYATFSGRSTLKEAMAEIDAVFKNVASSTLEGVTSDQIKYKSGLAIYEELKTKYKGNERQLAVAMNQVIETLSNQSVDALRSNYLSKTGDFSIEGFNKHLVGIISGEAGLRTNTEETISGGSTALSADNNNIVDKEMQIGQVVRSRDGATVAIDNILSDWGKTNMQQIPMLGGSSRANNVDRILPIKDINGTSYIYNSNLFGTSGVSGKPKNGTTLYRATDQGSYLIPIATGKKVQTDYRGKTTLVEDKDMKAGTMITFNPNKSENSFMNTWNIVDGELVDILVDDQYYRGYKNKNGEVVVVATKAFTQYAGYETPEGTQRSVVFSALDEKQSAQQFGDMTLSSYYKKKDFFESNSNKVLPEGAKLMEEEIKNMRGLLSEAIDSSKNPKAFTAKELKTINEGKAFLEENLPLLELWWGTVLDVENGISVPKSEAQLKEYTQLRFTINNMMNQLNDNKDMETIRRITTSMKNTMKANTNYNTLY